MEELKYYMFHKPRGCITAVTDPTHKTVMEYFADEKVEGLHPVGRLDKDTEGLLLITNDGKWNQEIMHPEIMCQKPISFGHWENWMRKKSIGSRTESNFVE